MVTFNLISFSLAYLLLLDHLTTLQKSSWLFGHTISTEFDYMLNCNWTTWPVKSSSLTTWPIINQFVTHFFSCTWLWHINVLQKALDCLVIPKYRIWLCWIATWQHDQSKVHICPIINQFVTHFLSCTWLWHLWQSDPPPLTINMF